MAKWKDKYNPEALLNKINKIMSINDAGQVQFRGMEIMTLPSQIEQMAILNPSVSADDKHTIVWRAICDAGKKGSLSSNNVLAEIDKLEIDFLSTKESKYQLVSTISNDSHEHSLSKTKIDQCLITFSPKKIKSYIKHILASPHINFHVESNKVPSHYTWVMVTVSAKSIHEAFKKGITALNIWRGQMNFILNYGSRSFSFGNKPTPINKICYGPLHTLHNTNGELADDIFWQEEGGLELPKAYCDRIVGSFDKKKIFLAGFQKKINNSKIKDKIIDALLLYNDALDSYSYDTAFLKLWATLEILTGTGCHADYDLTIKRASFIFKDAERIREHLNLLRECRNDLAHKGNFIGQKEILLFDLKMYVEEMLRFMLYGVKDLNNFGEFMRLLDCCPSKNGLLQSKNELEIKHKINKMALKIHY